MNEEQLKKVLNQQLARFFGQMTQHVGKRIDELRDELAPRIGHLQTSLDGVARRLDDSDVERVATNHQLERHEHWHKHTAKHVGLKLDYGEPA